MKKQKIGYLLTPTLFHMLMPFTLCPFSQKGYPLPLLNYVIYEWSSRGSWYGESFLLFSIPWQKVEWEEVGSKLSQTKSHKTNCFCGNSHFLLAALKEPPDIERLFTPNPDPHETSRFFRAALLDVAILGATCTSFL